MSATMLQTVTPGGSRAVREATGMPIIRYMRNGAILFSATCCGQRLSWNKRPRWVGFAGFLSTRER